MATYADWSASRQDPASNVSQQYHQDGSNGSGPVKLLIDGQGNLLHSSTSSSASGRPGYAGEFTHQQAPDLAMDRMAAMEDSQHNSMMSIDDQQEIVQNIRSSHRSGAGQHHQHQSHGNAYASTNDEQRAWTSRQLPPTTILLVIGTSESAQSTAPPYCRIWQTYSERNNDANEVSLSTQTRIGS